MKTAFASLLVFSVCARVFADDFTTTDGKKFEGVQVKRVEADGIVVMTDSGITKLAFANLPEDVQKKYGFDPAKAAQFQQQMRSEAAMRNARDAVAMRADESARRAQQFGLDLSKPLPDLSGPGKLGGFLGMPWGTPADIVNKVMLGRTGTTLNPKESTPSKLYYTGGTFSDRAVHFIALAFVDNGLCEASVFFRDTESSEVIFEDLQTALEKKYGRAEGNVNSRLADWRFPSRAQPRERLSLLLGSPVSLTYSNIPLAERAEQIRKSKLGTKDL